jgi:hypothetical protein
MAAESGADFHHRAPRLPSRRSWSIVPTRTATCSWSYVRRDGSVRERGPYWFFQFHEGGKRKKLYLGKSSDPERTLAAKRAKLSGSRLLH